MSTVHARGVATIHVRIIAIVHACTVATRHVLQLPHHMHALTIERTYHSICMNYR